VTFVLFVPRSTGYELREQEGEPPAVGSELELDDVRFQVTKIAPSPLPGDERRCAYVQGV
jgi:hypothetical protein